MSIDLDLDGSSILELDFGGEFERIGKPIYIAERLHFFSSLPHNYHTHTQTLCIKLGNCCHFGSQKTEKEKEVNETV